MSIGVVGAGIGGCVAAASLAAAHDVTIYEQAEEPRSAGAGIHLSANALNVLRPLGLASPLLSAGFRPRAFVSLDAQTGRKRFSLPLNGTDKPSDTYITIDRRTLSRALLEALPASALRLGHQLRAIDQTGPRARLTFARGQYGDHDLIIGADGIRSVTRRCLVGNERSTFTGQAVFRGFAHDVPPGIVGQVTKWWAEDRFIIAYPLTPNPKQIYFVAGIAMADWSTTAPFVDADRSAMAELFDDFEPVARSLLAASGEPTLWPLHEQPPGDNWFRDRIVLIGDACHPMRPHMAQGAAMAMEDAAVLARTLRDATPNTIEPAMRAYRYARQERIRRVQDGSSRNDWLRDPTNPDWIFEYDAWTAPISGQQAQGRV